MFYAEVKKNQISITQKEPITSGSVNAYLVQFAFSEEWSTLTRVAVFRTTGEPVEVLLDSVNECFIPWEVMTEFGKTIYFGVYGTYGDAIVLPTIWGRTDVILEGVITGLPAHEPTETLFGQIMGQLGSIQSSYSAIESKLDSWINLSNQQVTNLTSRITAIESQVQNISTSLTKVESDIVSIRAELSNTQNSFDDLLNQVEGSIDEIRSDVGSIDQRLIGVEEDLMSTNMSIADLQTEVAKHTARLDGIDKMLEDGVGSDYSAGDGIIIDENNVISIANPVRGAYSSAEYEALPESEKNSGLLIIDDDVINTSNNGVLDLL